MDGTFVELYLFTEHQCAGQELPHFIFRVRLICDAIHVLANVLGKYWSPSVHGFIR